jgi:hypothetical protein
MAWVVRRAPPQCRREAQERLEAFQLLDEGISDTLKTLQTAALKLQPLQ